LGKLQRMMETLEDLSVGSDRSALGVRALSFNLPRIEIDDTGKVTLFGFSSLKELTSKQVVGSLMLMTADTIVEMTMTTVFELKRAAEEIRFTMKQKGVKVLMADFGHPNMIKLMEGTLGFDDMEAVFFRAFSIFKSTQGEPADVVEDWFETFVKLMVFFIDQEERAESVCPPHLLFFLLF
jgi:hypothetical protein